MLVRAEHVKRAATSLLDVSVIKALLVEGGIGIEDIDKSIDGCDRINEIPDEEITGRLNHVFQSVRSQEAKLKAAHGSGRHHQLRGRTGQPVSDESSLEFATNVNLIAAHGDRPHVS